jgi:capsular polysaccharide biosynthesis protein
MTGPLKFKKKSVVPRVHYENVAYGKLRILWARKWLIAVLVVVALVLASVALVLLGPRYTGEAQIQINFTRDEPVNGAKIQPTATVDPAAVVEGAARIIRSRATADAVVARLGLDKDPTFTRQPLLWRALSDARSALGLEQSASSNHDLAVNRLMARISVTNDVRSYLILISVTSSDPALSATLRSLTQGAQAKLQLLELCPAAEVAWMAHAVDRGKLGHLAFSCSVRLGKLLQHLPPEVLKRSSIGAHRRIAAATDEKRRIASQLTIGVTMPTGDHIDS